MPRNTAAGKAAAGPSNTLDSKTIIILTPQAEFAEANTKIKQLQKLLKARDTFVFSDNLLDRLITVLKALA